jgi:hypothetical protein
VTLTEVTEKKVSVAHEEYSLFFRGGRGFFLPQGTYGFEHETLPCFDLFIVPVSEDEHGYTYQAAFSSVTAASRHE